MSNVETTVSHIGASALQQPPGPIGDNVTKNANAQLKSIIERIEAMDQERKVISDDIRDVYTEAKGNGYDIKALRKIVAMRKMDNAKRLEAETVLEIYMLALGML
jgi:uncharacterized protein (UPF0335 family)